MMNFVGASLKSAKNGTFFVAFHRARKSYYIDMNNMKKILPASHGVGLSIILDTIIKKFDRRKPFEGTHRTVVCST